MNWMRGLSIRARITLGTLAVALVLSIGAGFFLYFRVATIVSDTTVQLLDGDASPFEAAIHRDPTAPNVSAGEKQLVALVAPDGHLALTNLPDALTDKLHELKALGKTPTAVRNDGRDYLVSTERVHTPNGTWKIIVARSQEPGELVLNQLRMTLIIGALVLFVAFGITSWILSGVALRPVSRMRRKAEKLGQSESAETLPVGPARDELSALATTLNELLARNRESVERERQLLSDASHELRTPLAVLVAQLDELSAATRDGRTSSATTDDARQTARRLATLATNILELSKLEAGQSTQSSSWDVLVRELSTAIDRGRILANEKEAVVDFSVEQDAAESSDTHFPVGADSFGRLIDNLVANAITASPTGGGVFAQLSQTPDALTLVITDEGPGMPDEFIPVALDRFTRPDSARNSARGGSGLGLAIVGAIVSASGGRIELSNGHPGLRVEVSIPAEDVSASVR
jgi:signal transduction histidine kinase